MNPERWRLVTHIFHAALERPAEHRQTYLIEVCGERHSLRADVDALLAGEEQAHVAGDPLRSGIAALSAGSVLGPYRIDALIDVGGMGEVYRAYDTRLNRHVAIKVLPTTASSDPDRLARFELEARAAAALNHPNICAVFDIGMHEGAPFIVSELLEGQTLREVCDAGALPTRRALEYGMLIARALGAAHVKGIVHRDLKPENVFITTEGRVKLLDFGIAKLMARLGDADGGPTEPARTEVGMVMGTVGYMSPEQVRGLPADSRSDVFSFGTVLFEMLAGRQPFRGETSADTLSSILRQDPPALQPGHDVSAALERIVRRCLEKASANRFQSADDLAFALEALNVTAGALASPPVPVGRGSGPVRPSHVFIVLALVAVALAAWDASSPTVDLGAYRFTPFATDTQTARNPVWSPDGRSIAYDMSVDGRTQIFVRSLDADSAAQITNAPADADRPFWWPDGNHVGFLSGGLAWSVSRAGGAAELVQKGWIGAATLSPDGQTLATWRTDPRVGTFCVALASPPNAAPREYAPAPFKVKGWATPTFFAFSPDGRQLLLSDWTDAGETATWLLPYPDRAAAPHRVYPQIPGLTPQLEPAQMSWMPDSERALMVFRTASAPKGGLWITNVSSGKATPLSLGLTQQGTPSVSPDGSKIVFTAGGPGYDLVDVALDGSPMRDFLATGTDEYSGSWVPGSSKYVYLTNKNGEEELRIHSQIENWDRLIVATRTFGPTSTLSSPVASPDGQRVAFDVSTTGTAPAIWLAPVGGGAPVKLSPEGSAEGAGDWSPDGQSIVCNHDEQGVVGLAILRVGASDPPRVLAHRIAGVIPAWSPNGEWIAYQTNSDLRLISPDGARQRVLTTIMMSRQQTSYGWDTSLVWSRDSKRLYSVRRTEDRKVQVVEIDAATGAMRVVSTLGSDFDFATPSDPGLRFTLAQDGRSFLATVVRTRTQLWILENFARHEGLSAWFRRAHVP